MCIVYVVGCTYLCVGLGGDFVTNYLEIFN